MAPSCHVPICGAREQDEDATLLHISWQVQVAELQSGGVCVRMAWNTWRGW